MTSLGLNGAWDRTAAGEGRKPGGRAKRLASGEARRRRQANGSKPIPKMAMPLAIHTHDMVHPRFMDVSIRAHEAMEVEVH